jgi:hypothetical protein
MLRVRRQSSQQAIRAAGFVNVENRRRYQLGGNAPAQSVHMYIPRGT